jgi:hypothetical protein
MDTTSVLDAMADAKSNVLRWALDRAKAEYKTEMHVIIRSTFGLHWNAAHLRASQIQKASLGSLSKKHCTAAPNLWSLPVTLLDVDGSRR